LTCSLSFGLMQALVERSLCLSIESFGKLMSKVMCNAETKEMLEWFRVDPLAMTKFKAYLAGLYTCSLTGGGLRDWFMVELQRHWFCSSKPGAKLDQSLTECFRGYETVLDTRRDWKIIPYGNGWIRTCYSLNEKYSYVSWLYIRRPNPITPSCLSKLPVYNGHVQSVKTRQVTRAVTLTPLYRLIASLRRLCLSGETGK
jgi:hypothetical protein